MAKKAAEDFSELVHAQIPEFVALGNTNLEAAFESLLALEKKTRQGEDELSTHKVAVAIIKLAHDKGNLEMVISYLNLLVKRRAQFPQTILRMVQEAMTYIELLKTDNEKMELIDALRLITNGKMMVEVERARLTLRLARMKEAKGEQKVAAEIVQEVAVETLGAMDNVEKTDFILEQMRIVIENNDFERARVIARKVAPKALLDANMMELKQRYYRLCIAVGSHENDYVEVARSFLSIYNTPSVQEDETHAREVLRDAALYVCLAKHAPAQQDLINRILAEKRFRHAKDAFELVKYFTTPELIDWAVVGGKFRPILVNNHSAFAGPKAEARWNDLRSRVIEHNVRTIAKYYKRITLERLGTLLSLSQEETEAFVRDLVVEKAIYARMDRPAGLVNFEAPKSAADVLNEWSSNISTLLTLVENCSHAIQKEETMYHKA